VHRSLGRGRPHRRVDDDAGAVRRERRQRGHPRARSGGNQGRPDRDRRRVRRQDHALSGAARDCAVTQGRSPREDGDGARRSVPRNGSNVWHEGPHEARGQARRHARRCGSVALVRRRRLSRSAFRTGRHVLPRGVQDSEFLPRSLRRGRQQAEGGGVSRAGIADGDVRHRTPSPRGIRRRSGRSTVRSGSGRRSKPRDSIRTGARRSAPTRGGAWRAGSGSTPA